MHAEQQEPLRPLLRDSIQPLQSMPVAISLGDHVGQSIIQTDASPATAAHALVALNLGPIAELMKDDTVSDVLINGLNPIFVERGGVLEQTMLRFTCTQALDALAHSIVQSVGRKIDDERPLIDARLPDGSRVNVIMPPMAVDGTSISIRKFPACKITLDSMAESGIMSAPLAAFLKEVAKQRMNVLISGGTGAGKTTLMNALSRYISDKERVVTIEDSAELQLQQPHVVRLETKHPKRQGDPSDSVTIRDLVINALRMRPDRIIVGEVRGGEMFDMLQAMNTGHDGSMTTLHANTPRDALSRMENMINMSDISLSQKFIRQQITAALNVIIQTSRFKDGSRRITHVTEVVGMENDIITLQDLFTFQVTGEDSKGRIQGNFQWANAVPRCRELAMVAREVGLFNGIR